MYISQFEERLWADAGALVNEPQTFDANADLADVRDEAGNGVQGVQGVQGMQGVHNGLCIHLHNVSAAKLKLGMTVKVKLPDDRVAHFQLGRTAAGFSGFRKPHRLRWSPNLRSSLSPKQSRHSRPQ